MTNNEKKDSSTKSLRQRRQTAGRPAQSRRSDDSGDWKRKSAAPSDARRGRLRIVRAKRAAEREEFEAWRETGINTAFDGAEVQAIGG